MRLLRFARRVATFYGVLFGIDDALERARTRLTHH